MSIYDMQDNQVVVSVEQFTKEIDDLRTQLKAAQEKIRRLEKVREVTEIMVEHTDFYGSVPKIWLDGVKKALAELEKETP